MLRALAMRWCWIKALSLSKVIVFIQCFLCTNSSINTCATSSLSLLFNFLMAMVLVCRSRQTNRADRCFSPIIRSTSISPILFRSATDLGLFSMNTRPGKLPRLSFRLPRLCLRQACRNNRYRAWSGFSSALLECLQRQIHR